MFIVLPVSVLVYRFCSVKQASAVGSEADNCWVHQGGKAVLLAAKGESRDNSVSLNL